MNREWSCLDFETRWSDFHEGSLTPEEATAARRHIQECGACGALHAALGVTLEALADLPAVAPRAAWYETVLARTSSAGRQVRAAWSSAVFSPRFAMGLAMTVLTFSLVINNAAAGPDGVSWRSFTPAAVANNAQREAGRLRARAVGWVEDLKVVYEIESAVHANTPAPGGHSQRQESPRGVQHA